MPSHALLRWRTERALALDEVEDAHASVGGTGPGRRHTTQQINRAYAVLLSSEFQGFGYDLYSEAADRIVASVPIGIRAIMRIQFDWGQPFRRGNPQAGAIGSDFGRFGFVFWDSVYAVHAFNRDRRRMLDELMKWRNAIAHNDFDPAAFPNGTILQLSEVRQWRSGLNGLCTSFDRVLRDHLSSILGGPPWPP